MLVEREMTRLAHGLSAVSEPIRLRLELGSAPSSFAAELTQFAQQLMQRCPQIQVITDTQSTDAMVPALVFSDNKPVHIRYCAVPQGPELAPFVDAILALASGLNGNRAAWTHELNLVRADVHVWVFTRSECPYCPRVVRLANIAALTSAFINTTVIDAEAFASLVAQYRIRSLPTMLIDQRLALVGELEGDEFALLVRDRASLSYNVRLLYSLLEHGRVDDAEAHVLSTDGPAVFCQAWQQSVTATRIGLLLLCERVLDRQPRYLDAIVPELCEVLTSRNPTLRGDTADLLGRIGAPAARDALLALLGDANADVVEIAQEALAALREK